MRRVGKQKTRGNKIDATPSKHVLIIGGGASGLLAGLRAAECGARVTILEKMDRPGRKLAITGKGRGNLTTGNSVETAVSAFGPGGRFLRGAFSRFYSHDLIALLESLGVPTVMERGRRVFPLSHRAKDVVDILAQKLNDSGAVIEAGRRVSRVIVENDRAVGAETQHGAAHADAVILATGGASYPGTGSTGDGYKIALALGHSVVEPRPALVPLTLGGAHAELAALSLEHIGAALVLDGAALHEETGDILFTDFGVTGPAALPLGTIAARHSSFENMSLIVNFKPALSREQVLNRLQRDFAAHGRKTVKEIFAGLLPRRAIPVVLQAAGVPGDRRGSQVSKAERAALADRLQALAFPVTGTRPIAEAIITSGGVALGEVNPGTMESRIVPGLFFCGEILDIDAGTGGYNLQAAFSTGWVAGQCAAGPVAATK